MIQITTPNGSIECRIADTSAKRAIGLMMQHNIEPLFFDMGRESSNSCAMHTLFMLRTIDMVFVNTEKKVVDIKTAKPFKPIIRPKAPARYVIELPEGMSKMFELGQQLEFRGE
jgi:uncharacterized membrane protein (UPF0127 family)